MAKEKAVQRGDPQKSRGELTEGRPHPTQDVPAGDYPTNDMTQDDDAQKRREKRMRIEGAEGNR